MSNDEVGFKACLRILSTSIIHNFFNGEGILMLKVKYYLYTNITYTGSQSEVPKTFSWGPEILSFPTTYVKPDFLHILQPKQHIAVN